MSYSDPQTVTIGATPVTLPRTGSGESSGTFTSADGLVALSVSHAYGRRNQRRIRLTQTKSSADPLVPAQNIQSSMSVTLVVDVPKVGYTVAEEKTVVDALVAYLTASTGAKVTQLLGGES